MQFYWRLKRLFAVYMETSYSFGPRPLFKIVDIGNELMIEIPYGFAIITSRKKLQNENPSHYGLAEREMSNHEKRNQRLFTTPKRATKN